MKRLISLLLTLAMLAAMIPAVLTGVSAEDTVPAPKGNWTDEGNYDISWCKTLTEAKKDEKENLETLELNGKFYHIIGAWTNQTYHIDTPEKLAGLAYLSNKASGDLFKGDTFYIEADLDLSAHYWVPISKSSKFRGSLIGSVNGGAATLTGMTIDSSAKKDGSVGLIGKFGGGWLKDLKLVNASIQAHSFTVGSFVGWQDGNVGSGQKDNQGGYVNLCADTKIVLTSGQDDRYDDVGGMVGCITGANANNPAAIFQGCVFTGTISAPMGDNVGGIVGLSQYTGQKAPVISDCVVISEKLECGETYFNQEWNVGFGGIAGNLYSNTAGDADASTISNCYVAANMVILTAKTTNKLNVGGLVGNSCSQTKTYTNCQFDGIITGSAYQIGGLLGRGFAPKTFDGCVVSGIAMSKEVNSQRLTGNDAPTVKDIYVSIPTSYANSTVMAEQIQADTDLTALLSRKDTNGNAIWTKDEGSLYPILAVAKPYLTKENRHLSVAMSGADFSNFSFSGEMSLTCERELRAISVLTRAAGTSQAVSFLNARKLTLNNVLLPLLDGLFASDAAEALRGKAACTVDTAKVIGISAQTGALSEDGTTYSIRLVAEIAGSDWANAGFDILVAYTEADGTRKTSRLTAQQISVCYTSVRADGETVKPAEGHYFLVYGIHGIPSSNGNTEFTVSAWVADAEGTSYAAAGTLTFDGTGTIVKD